MLLDSADLNYILCEIDTDYVRLFHSVGSFVLIDTTLLR